MAVELDPSVPLPPRSRSLKAMAFEPPSMARSQERPRDRSRERRGIRSLDRRDRDHDRSHRRDRSRSPADRREARRERQDDRNRDRGDSRERDRRDRRDDRHDDRPNNHRDDRRDDRREDRRDDRPAERGWQHERRARENPDACHTRDRSWQHLAPPPQERGRVVDVDAAAANPPAPPSDTPPAVGSIHEAVVRRIQPFGIFVELRGFRNHGLVHNTQVDEMLQFQREDNDEDKVKGMEWAAPVGKLVKVKVVEVRIDQNGRERIGCSIKAVDQDTGADLDPENATVSLFGQGGGGGGFAGGGRGGPMTDDPPECPSIHRARVTQIRPFGVFVEMQGYRRWGLVHLSQLSNHMEFERDDSDEQKVEAMRGVVSEGENVWVKVVELRDDDQGKLRIGCSLKLVNQRDGEDLDPNGLQYQPRENFGGGRRQIGDGAAETNRGKIDWGHHAGDVKQMGGSGKYDLVESDDEGPAPLPDSLRPPPPPVSNLEPSRSLGRGRGMVMPAWMTNPDMEAPGSRVDRGAEVPEITSIEQAMAILREGERGKKKKKDKKDKKAKKKTKKKAKKAKKSKKDSGSESSSSDSD